jgi:hypothetical protein
MSIFFDCQSHVLMRQTIDIPDNRNRQLEPTGLAKPGKTHGLTGTGAGLACQDAAGQGFGHVWDRTEPFEGSKLDHWRVTRTRC